MLSQKAKRIPLTFLFFLWYARFPLCYVFKYVYLICSHVKFTYWQKSLAVGRKVIV